MKNRTNDIYCTRCGHEMPIVEIDEGIGHFEHFGTRGTDTHIVKVCAGCHSHEHMYYIKDRDIVESLCDEYWVIKNMGEDCFDSAAYKLEQLRIKD